ncbi:MAG: fold metallo-hydrolase [Chloroflexi bacterium]|jgi:glyoxylase-like metal-dependent hydrolase (beta-lactamase superfamily II)|nr:fold metallo-hydrolase [Chloroflexota bacterium]
MQISRSCYALTGLACEPPWTVNAGFITGAGRTLIVDTGANTLAARTIQGYVQAANPGSELLVINTEQHLDHIGGNYYFREQGIEVLEREASTAGKKI